MRSTSSKMCPSLDVKSWPSIILSRPSITAPDAGNVTAIRSRSGVDKTSICANRGQFRATILLEKREWWCVEENKTSQTWRSGVPCPGCQWGCNRVPLLPPKPLPPSSATSDDPRFPPGTLLCFLQQLLRLKLIHFVNVFAAHHYLAEFCTA